MVKYNFSLKTNHTFHQNTASDLTSDGEDDDDDDDDDEEMAKKWRGLVRVSVRRVVLRWAERVTDQKELKFKRCFPLSCRLLSYFSLVLLSSMLPHLTYGFALSSSHRVITPFHTLHAYRVTHCHTQHFTFHHTPPHTPPSTPPHTPPYTTSYTPLVTATTTWCDISWTPTAPTPTTKTPSSSLLMCSSMEEVVDGG